MTLDHNVPERLTGTRMSRSRRRAGQEWPATPGRPPGRSRRARAHRSNLGADREDFRSPSSRPSNLGGAIGNFWSLRPACRMPFQMQSFIRGEYEEAAHLWQMSKPAFNTWRRANDLPGLLEFFKGTLPRFSKWQAVYNITDTDVLSVDHTSHLFAGTDTKHLVDFTEPERGPNEPERVISVTSLSGWELKSSAERERPGYTVEIHGSKPFIPYFSWVRTMGYSPFFRIPHDRNNQFVDDFEYRSWQGMNLATSRASLFYNQEVLKLGGTTIGPGRLDGRNLDFVDLDGLTVTGSGSTYGSHIAYASCRDITFRNSDKAFLTFTRCNISGLTADNCRFQDLYFVTCKLSSPRFKNSRLFRVAFIDSMLGGIDLENCDLVDLKISKPHRQMTFDTCVDLYRRFRVAFQQKGNRKEAGEYYFRERVAELLSNISPFVPPDERFPQPVYRRPYRELWSRMRAGEFTRKQAGKFVLGNCFAHMKLLTPRFLFRFAAAKIGLLGQALDWGVWGFGERPARVFVWMLVVLCGFATKYYFLGGKDGHLRGAALESLYCSAFNFATIGCDYKTSLDSVEGVLGATLLGIMVAGFGNRTRY
jgi:hypothetical protein